MIKPLNIDIFAADYGSEDDCLKMLADEKWKNGYSCRKCGHDNYCLGRTSYSRRCTRCKHEESATAHTIFHRCRIPITEAFQIVYRVCSNPAVSTYELSRQMEIRQMTCWKLKSKLMECLERRGSIDLLFESGSD